MGDGKVKVTKALLKFQLMCWKNSPHQCCLHIVALTAMIMMIIIIPRTSPTTFRVLAVFDALAASVDSPTALAFCAFEKQVSEVIC